MLIGHSDHEKTAWKITNNSKAKVIEPNTGCNTQRSMRSDNVIGIACSKFNSRKIVRTCA